MSCERRPLAGMFLALVAAIACRPSVLPAQSPPSGHKVGQRWALLIGVDDYAEVQKLDYCGTDMRALREQLVGSGFPDKQLFLLQDAAPESKYRPLKANIERQLDVVLDLVEPDNLLLVAFSGHGAHIEGKSFLCPVEARLDDPKTLVPLDGVYQRLEKCRAALKILLVDACRNDPRPGGQRSMRATAQTKQFATSVESPPHGILALTSCAPGQVSWEEKEFGHGVFMHYVLEGLKGQADQDGNGRVSLLELYKYANRETKVYVARKWNTVQTPALRGDIPDDFDFSEVRKTSPPLAVAPFDADAARQHQEAWSRHLGQPRELTNSIGMKLVLVPAGEFLMGSPDSEKDRSSDEGPQHRVRITKPFYLGAYEVTQGEYERVMGKNPSWFSAGGSGKEKVSGEDTSRFPVEGVSWEEAVEFCRKLSAQEGKEYRLPTEAEWEYACRGGTTTPFSFGSVLNGREANCAGNVPYGSEEQGPYLGRPARVGSYASNAFGLYDMHGNVWEWCSDWYGAQYYAASPASDPIGPNSGYERVLRGGTWAAGPSGGRSAFRRGNAPDFRSDFAGFRVARAQ